jgi:hypothetical protein
MRMFFYIGLSILALGVLALIIWQLEERKRKKDRVAIFTLLHTHAELSNKDLQDKLEDEQGITVDLLMLDIIMNRLIKEGDIEVRDIKPPHPIHGGVGECFYKLTEQGRDEYVKMTLRKFRKLHSR